jgi:coenzyme F420-0:L-glutamate ligase / coenzyme F420-1:gamma-L-glutamate ligase
MPDLSNLLRQRRSIRHFEEKSVPLEIIWKLLETASFAPSAHNAQPWRFIILTQDEAKCHLADAMGEVWLEELKKDGVPQRTREDFVRASAERFSTAPILVLACLTLEDMDKYPDERRQEFERDLAVQSLAAAVQTLLLAAHDEGLGSCWYCSPVFCKDAVKEALAIPDGVEPQALITIGYPAESPRPPERIIVEDFASLEKWDQPFKLHEQA